MKVESPAKVTETFKMKYEPKILKDRIEKFGLEQVRSGLISMLDLILDEVTNKENNKK